MNEREHLFRIWAPPGSRWSNWAKPVLFAHLPPMEPRAHGEISDIDVTSLPQADGSTAIVIDLPAAQSIALAILLATRGYRPAPLFNAVPGPLMHNQLGILHSADHVSVNLGPAIRGILDHSQTLESLNLPPSAPPAFLLDSLRRTGRRPFVGPGDFDNRSVSFPTDFPSAAFLAEQGIQQVLLIQSQSNEPAADLAHTLRRWQDAGIAMLIYVPPIMIEPQPMVVYKPRRFRLLWYQLLATLGLRRSPLGGFGGVLPTPSAG